MNENLRNALPHKNTPFLRVLHIIVAVLILLQIINSNLTESDALSDYTLTGFVTWFHVITGLSLIVLGDSCHACMDADTTRISLLFCLGGP